jgi:hypothetical protein
MDNGGGAQRPFARETLFMAERSMVMTRHARKNLTQFRANNSDSVLICLLSCLDAGDVAACHDGLSGCKMSGFAKSKLAGITTARCGVGCSAGHVDAFNQMQFVQSRQMRSSTLTTNS